LRVLHNRTKVWPLDLPGCLLTGADGTISETIELEVGRGDRIFLVLGTPQAEPARVTWPATVEAI
jgi:hypothetical protein